MGDVYMLNGKILSGLPNHAKDIVFDNTGSPLNSTNTEDAIKEVNSNLTVQDITSQVNIVNSNVSSCKVYRLGHLIQIDVILTQAIANTNVINYVTGLPTPYTAVSISPMMDHAPNTIANYIYAGVTVAGVLEGREIANMGQGIHITYIASN